MCTAILKSKFSEKNWYHIEVSLAQKVIKAESNMKKSIEVVKNLPHCVPEELHRRCLIKLW